MSWNLPKTWTSGAVLTKSDLDQQIRDNLNFLKVNIALESAEELTISGGIVTRSQGHHTVDTEDDDPSDELETIAGGHEGDVILIRPADPGRTVTLKHAAGNIRCPGDCDLILTGYLMLAYDGNLWQVIGSGDMLKAVYDADNDGVVEEADHADTLDGDHLSDIENTMDGKDAAAISGHASDADAHHSELHSVNHKADGIDQILLNELGLPGADIDLNSQKIANLADPEDGQDAATKKYVDDSLVGIETELPAFRHLAVPEGYGLFYDDSTFEVFIRESRTDQGDHPMVVPQGFRKYQDRLQVWC